MRHADESAEPGMTPPVISAPLDKIMNKAEAVRTVLNDLGTDASSDDIKEAFKERFPYLHEFMASKAFATYVSLQKKKMRGGTTEKKKEKASSGDTPIQTLQALVDEHGREFVQKLIGMM